jgi:multidrug efflux pump subunit AcrA (membrane-fusion protein)
VRVAVAAAVKRPVARYIRVTGTLTAQEAAEVAAEVTGRIVATPVERGTRVGRGATLVRIAATEVDAQAREAEANAAQLEAKLGLDTGGEFDLQRVPEVANARAAFDLAQTDFERVRMLSDKQLVSKAEFDLRAAQAEAARRQYEVARNSAAQQYQALVAARARVALARKAVDDTVVRAPDGVVGESSTTCLGRCRTRTSTFQAAGSIKAPNRSRCAPAGASNRSSSLETSSSARSAAILCRSATSHVSKTAWRRPRV